MGEEFRCLDFGVAKDFVTDLVVGGSNSGMSSFWLVKFRSSSKKLSKSKVEGSSPSRPECEVILRFLVSKCWKLPQKCVVEGQMQILLLEASSSVFRCLKCLFRASLVVKSRDLVVFRVVAEILECNRHM